MRPHVCVRVCVWGRNWILWKPEVPPVGTRRAHERVWHNRVEQKKRKVALWESFWKVSSEIEVNQSNLMSFALSARLPGESKCIEWKDWGGWFCLLQTEHKWSANESEEQCHICTSVPGVLICHNWISKDWIVRDIWDKHVVWGWTPSLRVEIDKFSGFLPFAMHLIYRKSHRQSLHSYFFIH